MSFDCPDGPADIITDGKDGLLVPHGDVDALATKISDLINDPDRRASLAKQDGKVQERFALEKIANQWKNVINEIINTRNAIR